eukprot:gb/GFBE01041848.1/.p1 GENE.gb/GFBE01041848.1/~~gb/GFBE01041848.1/.p1  ORF type:complete len:263 (+),score=38.25 gb/GFBE01041848.1/:1-789(+)
MDVASAAPWAVLLGRTDGHAPESCGHDTIKQQNFHSEMLKVAETHCAPALCKEPATRIAFQCCHCLRIMGGSEDMLMLLDRAYCSRDCRRGGPLVDGVHVPPPTGTLSPKRSLRRRASSVEQFCDLSTADSSDFSDEESDTSSAASRDSYPKTAGTNISRNRGAALSAAILREVGDFLDAFIDEVTKLARGWLQSTWTAMLGYIKAAIVEDHIAAQVDLGSDEKDWLCNLSDASTRASNFSRSSSEDLALPIVRRQRRRKAT